MNVTDVPAQIAPEGDAAMLTLAARIGLTTIVNVLDVAGLPVTHARLDVIWTFIASPFARVDEV